MSKLLSIIVPIYNEENLIPISLPAIMQVQINKEVIAIDDGSSDNSFLILQELQKKYDFVLLKQEKNMGKGEAVKRGLEEIKGDYFIICDADLEYNPQEINKLYQLAKTHEHEDVAIYGSRFMKNKKIDLHYLANAFLTKTTNLLFKSHLTDMETCYKLIPSKALEKIKLNGKRFEIEPEITAKLLKNNYKIIETPISYKKRSYQEGKKN
jgi:glycosyltransferase involved in cell wall biosynthesis